MIDDSLQLLIIDELANNYKTEVSLSELLDNSDIHKRRDELLNALQKLYHNGYIICSDSMSYDDVSLTHMGMLLHVEHTSAASKRARKRIIIFLTMIIMGMLFYIVYFDNNSVCDIKVYTNTEKEKIDIWVN